MSIKTRAVCLATYASPSYAKLAALTLPSKYEYCAYRDLTMYDAVYDGPIDRVGWNRLAFVLDRLVEGFDAVIWTGADVMILDYGIDVVAETLDQYPENDLFVSADLHGLNSDVFIARNTDLMKQFLFVIGSAYGVQHFGEHPWGEQAAMIHLLASPPYHNLARYMPQTFLNAYMDENGFPDYVTRHNGISDVTWAVQAAGVSMETRLRVMGNLRGQQQKGEV